MNRKIHSSSSKAFTLVELAIVIIIIGLITGGVIGAQSLIEGAKKTKIISNISQFKNAIRAFYLEYESLPGDFNEASSYFGTDCHAVPTRCNGNGNKLIADHNIIGSLHESRMAWKHLSLAEIMAGDFYGGYLTWPDYNISDTYPLGDNDNSMYVFSRNFTNSAWINVDSKNYLATNICYVTENGHYHDSDKGESLSVKTAYSIDKKLDDKMPFTGQVTSVSYNNALNANCHLGGGSYQSDTEYNLENTSSESCKICFFLHDKSGHF